VGEPISAQDVVTNNSADSLGYERNNIVNLREPSAQGDSATKGYVDNMPIVKLNGSTQ
jgi:hypothetical protein